MSEHVYNKPVVCIFKERDVHHEVDPFVVVKAKNHFKPNTELHI